MRFDMLLACDGVWGAVSSINLGVRRRVRTIAAMNRKSGIVGRWVRIRRRSRIVRAFG